MSTTDWKRHYENLLRETRAEYLGINQDNDDVIEQT